MGDKSLFADFVSKHIICSHQHGRNLPILLIFWCFTVSTGLIAIQRFDYCISPPDLARLYQEPHVWWAFVPGVCCFMRPIGIFIILSTPWLSLFLSCDSLHCQWIFTWETSLASRFIILVTHYIQHPSALSLKLFLNVWKFWINFTLFEMCECPVCIRTIVGTTHKFTMHRKFSCTLYTWGLARICPSSQTRSRTRATSLETFRLVVFYNCL